MPSASSAYLTSHVTHRARRSHCFKHPNMHRFTALGVVVVAAMVIGLSEGACPEVACHLMMIPEEFRAPSYTVHGKELCPNCDLWIDPTMPKDSSGCPPRACPMFMPRPGCQVVTTKKYLLWAGQMCPDCDVIYCEGDVMA